MEVNLSCERLTHALEAVHGVLPARRKSGSEKLSGVLIEAAREDVTLITTNGQVRVSSRIQGVEVIGEGACVVPHAKLLKYAQACPPGARLTLHLAENNRLEILREGEPAVQLEVAARGSFPALCAAGSPGDTYTAPIGDEVRNATIRKSRTQRLIVPRAVLVEAIKSVAFAASRDAKRLVFQAILLHMREENRPTLVAADANRLAVYTVPGHVESVDWSCDVLLLARAVEQAVKVLPDGDVIEIEVVESIVQLTQQGTQPTAGEGPSPACIRARLTCGDVTVSLLPVSGRYPNYEMIIPTSWKLQVTCSAPDLRDVLQRLVPASRKQDQRVVLRLDPDLVMVRRFDDQGFARENAVAAQGRGEPVERIVFDGCELSEFLQASRVGSVTLELNGPSRPCLFRHAESNAGSFIYIQMPQSPNKK